MKKLFIEDDSMLKLFLLHQTFLSILQDKITSPIAMDVFGAEGVTEVDQGGIDHDVLFAAVKQVFQILEMSMEKHGHIIIYVLKMLFRDLV